MNDSNGWLPNYGANDGALFFRLNECHYRDYRPQLQALAVLLDMDAVPAGAQRRYVLVRPSFAPPLNAGAAAL